MKSHLLHAGALPSALGERQDAVLEGGVLLPGSVGGVDGDPALGLELVRWCRRPVLALVGMGKPGPDIRCVSVKEEGPCCDWSAVVELLAEEALETTEELWAARRRVRSRVRRFT